MTLKKNAPAGVQKAPKKRSTTIRLNPEIIDFSKSNGYIFGKGWQTEINDVLQRYVNSYHAVYKCGQVQLLCI